MTTPGNPFQTPPPKGIRLLQGTLRVIVAVQCWGLAAGRLHHRRITPLSELLDEAYQIGPQALGRVEDAVALALVVCGLITLLRPMTLVLIPVILWQITLAVTAVIAGEGTLPALEPALQAVRIVVPLTLLTIDFWPPRISPTLLVTLTSMTLLRLAMALTFVGHGVIALVQFRQGGDWVELLILTVREGVHREISPEVARVLLAAMGAMNVALSLALLSSRNRAIALWMACWGFLTAFSHTVAYGIDGYDLTLLHIADGGAPLTVLLFWLTAVREQKPVLLPEPRSAPDDSPPNRDREAAALAKTRA